MTLLEQRKKIHLERGSQISEGLLKEQGVIKKTGFQRQRRQKTGCRGRDVRRQSGRGRDVRRQGEEAETSSRQCRGRDVKHFHLALAAHQTSADAFSKSDFRAWKDSTLAWCHGNPSWRSCLQWLASDPGYAALLQTSKISDFYSQLN